MTLTSQWVVPAPARDRPFLPSTFTDLLQQRIGMPGLDPAYEHTLVDVQVADDGAVAVLTVRSEPVAPLDLDQYPTLLGGVGAHVRVVGPDGAVITQGRYPAPLVTGGHVTAGDVLYRVVGTAWPLRDASTGTVTGDYDWQYATVVPADPPPPLPVATESSVT